MSGYAAGTEPTGRYFAPASTLGCMALTPDACGAPDLYFHGPTLAEFDFKFVKKFPTPGKTSFEFDVEVFNVFAATNFTPNFSPTATNPFNVTAQQSGARSGQLVARFTF